MPHFHRVFCHAETALSVETIRSELGEHDLTFGADGEEWFWFEVRGDDIIRGERFHVEEEGIRAELNSWAAYVEACEASEDADILEQIIQSRHLITIQHPETADEETARLAGRLGRLFSEQMDGLHQEDGVGIYSSEGKLLVPLTESAEPE